MVTRIFSASGSLPRWFGCFSKSPASASFCLRVCNSSLRNGIMLSSLSMRRGCLPLCWQPAPLIIGDDNAEDAPSFPRDPLTDCGRNQRRQTQIFEKRTDTARTDERIFVVSRRGCALRANATHLRPRGDAHGVLIFSCTRACSRGKVGAVAHFCMCVPMTRGE